MSRPVPSQLTFSIVILGGGLLVVAFSVVLYGLLLIAFALLLNMAGAVADVLAILLSGLGAAFGFRRWWRYATMRAREASPGPRRLKLAVYLALVGAMCAICLIIGGTLLLGHMRPMWLELDYAGPAALGGLLVGGLIGLAFDLL